MAESKLRTLVKRVLPRRWRDPLRRSGLAAWPPVGRVRFGSLDRTRPIGSDYGLSRGTPIDRRYIESFLAAQAGDVRGRVLEFEDDAYTRRFGKAVDSSAVLNVDSGIEDTTVVGSLENPTELPRDAFDCIVCTQVLQYVADPALGVRSLHQMLAPGGVLLLTVPGIAKIDRAWTDYWRFTTDSAARLLTVCFDESEVEIRAYGNVLAAVSFLEGLAVQDVGHAKLDVADPDYEVVVAVRAVKSR